MSRDPHIKRLSTTQVERPNIGGGGQCHGLHIYTRFQTIKVGRPVGLAQLKRLVINLSFHF